MGFFEVYTPTYAYHYGLRKNGSSEDIYERLCTMTRAAVECDGSWLIEGKIEDLAVDFFVVGYAEAVTITEKSSSDAGSGSEASSQIATLSKADSGSGTEGTPTQAAVLAKSDSGSSSDALTSLLAALAKSETGSGVDAYVELVIIGQELSSSDVGAGIDALVALNIALVQSDTGSGLDAATLSKAFLSADSGIGLEALANLLALIITNEVGSGSEQLRAKIMTSAGVSDMKLPTKMGKTEIPPRG